MENGDSHVDPLSVDQSLIMLGPRTRKVPASLREGFIGEVPKSELNVRTKAKKPVAEKSIAVSSKSTTSQDNPVVTAQPRAERKRKASSLEMLATARKEDSFSKEVGGMKETKQDVLEETLISQTFRKGGPRKFAAAAVAAVNKPKSFKDQAMAYAHSLKETSSIIIDWEADATQLLGKLCKVFWDGEQSWFYARVINYDPYNGRYFIYYFADSTGEWIDLSKECVLIAKDILQAKVSRSTSLWPATPYEAPNELTRKALSLFTGFSEDAIYVEFFNDTNAAENEYAFVQANHTKSFDELKLNSKASKKLVASVDAVFAEKQTIDAAREEALRTTRANLLRVLFGEELLDMRVRANATVIDNGKAGEVNPSFYCAGTIKKYCPMLNQHFVIFDEESLQPRWVDCSRDETLECLFDPNKVKKTTSAPVQESSSMDIAENKEDNVSSIDEMAVVESEQQTEVKGDSDTDEENEEEDTIETYCNLCERSCSMENHGLRCRDCGIFCHDYCIPEEGFNPMNAVTKLKNPLWVCWNCSDCANCAVTLWNRPLIYWNSKKQVPKGHEKALLLCGWCLYHYKHQEEYCIICYKLYVYQVFASSSTSKITNNGNGDQAPSYAADQKMIQCNECDRWIHARCEGIDDNQFDSIANGSHPIWGDEYFCPMCRNDICAQIMRQFFYLDTSGLFHHPVSELVAANYYDIIHSPMDLSTMRDRANRGYYKSAHPLRQDAELICLNALTFNRPGDSVWNASKTFFSRVQEVFEKSPRKTTISSHGKECIALIEAYRSTKAKEQEAKRANEEQALIQSQVNGNEVSTANGESKKSNKNDNTSDSDNIIISINIVESKQPESFATNRILAMSGEEAWFMSFVDQCFACGTAPITNHTLFCVDCGEVFHDFCAGTDCSRMTIDDQWSWRCVNCKICELCCTTKANDAETLVLCEQCDRAYHISCISPALEAAPDYAFTCGTCLKCESCSSDSKALWGNCINVCWPCMEAKRLPTLSPTAHDSSNNGAMAVTEESVAATMVARIQIKRRRRRDQDITTRNQELHAMVSSKEQEHFFQAMLIINLTITQLFRNPFRTGNNVMYHNDYAWRHFLQPSTTTSAFNALQAARARRSLGFFRRRIRSFDPVTQNVNSNSTFTLSCAGLQRVAQNASALSYVIENLIPKESPVKYSYALLDALQAGIKCVVRDNDSNETRFSFPLASTVITRGDIIPTALLDVLTKTRDMFKQFYPFQDIQELVSQAQGTATLHASSADLAKVVLAIHEKLQIIRNSYLKNGTFKILEFKSEPPLPLALPEAGQNNSTGSKPHKPLQLFNRHDGRLKTLSRYNVHTQSYEEVKHIVDYKEQGIGEQIKTILANATERADFKRFCAAMHDLQIQVQRFFDHQDRLHESKPPSEAVVHEVHNEQSKIFTGAYLQTQLIVPPPADTNEAKVAVADQAVNKEITVDLLKQLSASYRAQKAAASSNPVLPQALLGWTNESSSNDKVKAYSSIPWSNHRTCCFCQNNSDDDALLGRILPFPDISKHMHSNCLYWCEESRQTDAGTFEKAVAAKDANMRLRCLLCEKPGASVVCLHNKSCRSTYHLHCAIASQCLLLKRKKDWATPKRWDHGNESDRSAEGLARNGHLEKFMLCACHAIDVHEYLHYELWQPSDTNRFLAIESKAETTEKQVIAAADILSSTKSEKVIRVGSLTIWSLGVVPVGYVATASGLHGFSTPEQLYPLHFRSSRIFWSSVNPQERATYVFDILCLKDLDFAYTTEQMDAIFEQLFDSDNMILPAAVDDEVDHENGNMMEAEHEGEDKEQAPVVMMAETYNGPIFRVVGSDNPVEPLFSRSLSTLHSRLLERVAACRASTLTSHGHHDRDTKHVYGFTPEQFFGIGLPVVRRALEQSIEAVQCMLLLDEKERYQPTTRLPTEKEIKLAQVRLNRLDGNELAAERRAESCARAEPIGDTDASQPKVMRKVLTKVADGTDAIAASVSSATAPVLMDDEERREMEISLVESERRRQRFLTMRQEYLRDPERRLDVKRSRIHGWGLFSKVKLHQDDVIVEYVGEKVRQAVADRREVLYEEEGVGSCYLFRLDKQEIVDATRIGGIARFINHSCEPCAYARVISCRKESPAGITEAGADGEAEEEKHIVILALRDIDAGEEITYDYKFPVEDKKLRCYCGASRCSGSMN